MRFSAYAESFYIFFEIFLLYALCLFVCYKLNLIEKTNGFSTIQIKYIRKISTSLLKYSTLNKVKYKRPTLYETLMTIFLMTAPAWNIIYLSYLLAFNHVHFCSLIKVNRCSF